MDLTETLCAILRDVDPTESLVILIKLPHEAPDPNYKEDPFNSYGTTKRLGGGSGGSGGGSSGEFLQMESGSVSSPISGLGDAP
jgi:hypothetical protein